MRVQCSISMTISDIRCPVCGQGVLIHNAARSRDLLQMQRMAVREGLREQHIDGGHGAVNFTVEIPQSMPEAPVAIGDNLPVTAFAS